MTSEQQQINDLKAELEELRGLLYKDNFSALQIIRKQQQFADGINLELGSSDGTKIGTAVNQKIGFYGNVPLIQQPVVPKASGGTTIDTQARAAINSLIAELEDLGIISD